MTDGRSRVYRRPGERYNDMEVNRFQRGVMVWGAITANEKLELVTIHGNMNARRYIDDVLDNVVVSYIQRVDSTGATNIPTRQRTSSCCSNYQRISTGAQLKHIQRGYVWSYYQLFISYLLNILISSSILSSKKWNNNIIPKHIAKYAKNVFTICTEKLLIDHKCRLLQIRWCGVAHCPMCSDWSRKFTDFFGECRFPKKWPRGSDWSDSKFKLLHSTCKLYWVILDYLPLLKHWEWF